MSLTSEVGNPPNALVVPSEPIWRLSVERYHVMIRAGILTEDDPIELLDGWLVEKMVKSRAHSIVTRQIRVAIEAILPAGWYVDCQEPVTLSNSEPEPDAIIVRGTPADYPDSHPGPRDVGLVVEVADATLRRDRALKKAIYAGAGIAEYWIVNLAERQIEVYTNPSGPGEQPDYGQRRDFRSGERIPLLLDGREMGTFRVGEILPA
jgi:Uma2 family endonuclease